MREPHKPTCCPACASSSLAYGSVSLGDGSAARFRPDGVPLLRFERSAPLMAGSRFFACLDCDLVWSNAVPGHLTRLLGDR
jgi:hypothetical protein